MGGHFFSLLDETGSRNAAVAGPDPENSLSIFGGALAVRPISSE
jgi:hypothetical protein